MIGEAVVKDCLHASATSLARLRLLSVQPLIAYQAPLALLPFSPREAATLFCPCWQVSAVCY